MIEVKIPAEIKDYKSKLVANLSVRQIISLAGALLVGVPLGVFGSKFIPADILPWIIIIAVAPILGYGWITFMDMKFEDLAKSVLAFNFLPQRRVYEDTEVNLFHELHTEMIARDIEQQRIDNGEFEIEEEWR